MIGRCFSDTATIRELWLQGHGCELPVSCPEVARNGGNMFCIGCIISAVAECRNEGTKQAKLVEAFLKSIDKECEEISNETASNIARGVKNPSGYLMDALGKISAESYKSIVPYFQSQVVPLIKENEKNNVRDALILMIQEAQEIADDTVVELVNGIKKADLTDEVDLADFLVGIFLFALKNTKNNVGGSAKRVTREYLARVKKGEKPAKKKAVIREDNKDLSNESEQFCSDYRSREVELMEERIEQEAISFCRKYKKQKDYIALCQVAFITNPTRVHHRDMYNEFCEFTTNTRNRILEISEVDKMEVSGDYWWHKYLDMFENDYENYALGDESYRYSFAKYFYKLLEYEGAPIDEYTRRVFTPNIITSSMKLFHNSYKHDVAGLIDEYIYYKDYEEYNNVLEPPMDFMWRELDFDKCPELMLASFLALFIIGTCRGIPFPKDSVNKMFAFSGPGASEVETAEDLFYQTLLTLYENYEVAK